MNSDKFSAHPNEKEVLLMEGAPVAVMAVDQVLIDNTGTDDSILAEFKGKKITIVYMFHTFKGTDDNL